MAYLALASALLLLPQGETLGELSRLQFLNQLTSLGYTVVDTKEETRVTISNGETTATLGFYYSSHGEGAPRFVHGAAARLEFDVPRSVPKKQLQLWQEKEKLNGVGIDSYLGGRVVISGLRAHPETTRSQLKLDASRFFEGCKKLSLELALLGGKRLTTISEPATGPVELDFKLDWIDREDMLFLRRRFDWGNDVGPVVMRGWDMNSQPLGIPVHFHGMHRATFVYLTCLAKPNLQKAKRFLNSRARVDWAEATVTLEEVRIQKRLDFENGITVRELRDRILEFARRVKRLDLF